MTHAGTRAVAVSLLAMISGLAQNRVDPVNTYHRALAVVPFTGTGTFADQRRPMYAPLPSQVDHVTRKGILAYSFVESDDGKLALVEFVAADPPLSKTSLPTPP